MLNSKHRIKSYLEKNDEIKSGYISILYIQTRSKTSIAVSTNGINMNETYLTTVVPWAKTRCSQECMVFNYGKLILEENLQRLIKASLLLYKTLPIKNLQIVYGSQKIDIL